MRTLAVPVELLERAHKCLSQLGVIGLPDELRALLAAQGGGEMIPSSFRLPWSRFINGHPYQRAEIVATKFNGSAPEMWAVREGGSTLNREGEWEYEPTPSERGESYLARTRWDTPENAFTFAKTHFETPAPEER